MGFSYVEGMPRFFLRYPYMVGELNPHDFYLQLINRIDFTFDWLDLHRKGLEITVCKTSLRALQCNV